MMNITVKEAAQVADADLVSSKENERIKGFSIDSRTILPGEIFIAVKGENFDGHDFIKEALNKGASGVIAEHAEKYDVLPMVSHLLLVEDTLQAMGSIAALLRSRANIPVVCVTGTNGKTTVKELLARLLSANFKVLKSHSSYNNIVGLSLTLFGVDESHEVAVLELGTNHPGEIPVLSRIAAPHIAVITNIGDGHLEHFVDREGVFIEKMSILDHLSRTGMAFLNRDDPFLARVSERDIARKFYGMTEGADFLISDLSKTEEGYRFRLNGEAYFLPMEGGHNVYNAAAAISVAGYFGISHEVIRESLKDFSPPGMRLERVFASGTMFINDSYNANPDSFECALKVLKQSTTKRKKGIVAGQMGELGEKSAEFHLMIGKSIGQKGFDFLITLGDGAALIAEGAIEEGMPTENILRAQTHEEAAELLKQLVDGDTLVLLKGSRKAKMEEILKCFTICCTR
ncbi:MAG: UDP-N-acetylmuramoyl-tripeptide--D-alanyl-D-alanine ligase [Candidatus Omnitrophica bacterium]|nr:UDP-N-acetylmuramoyl-tripeptide--D-alanyl-D-alanine ligase [Candidatus Omnitrophota bacterium]